MSKKIIHKSAMPGVEYHVTKVGSNRYVTVVHKRSGVPIVNFTFEPVKVTEVILLCETNLKCVNWDIPVQELTEAHTKAYLAVRRYIFKK